MASRLHSCRQLLAEFEASLSAFQASNRKFRVLKTIRPPQTSHPSGALPSIEDACRPIKGTSDSPRTLYILDSSFNPPSKAHQHLALSALSRSSISRHPGPHRLLLLFAVLNADKGSSSPAAFPERLTMMSLFAQDLLQDIAALDSPLSCSNSPERDNDRPVLVSVDIAITKAPYYTDKSEAISEAYDADAQGAFYPDSPVHIHLLGFDTLTRFFNPKYYSQFDPPLSALKKYFDNGHTLRATLRPDDSFGSEDEQRSWLKRLEAGELEGVGGRREWSKQVELVRPNDQMGVSSTRIRKAAASADWDVVDHLCSSGVAARLKEANLYS